MSAKRKVKVAPILKPLRTDYGAGLFPGFPRTIEGAAKSMWRRIIDHREYNNGVVYDRVTGEEEGRIRMTKDGWVVTFPKLVKGRKFIRRVK